MARRRSRIEGVDRLTRRLRYFNDETRVQLGDTIEELANEVRDYARGYAVQSSLVLPHHIHAKTDKNALGARVGFISRFARRLAWYAPFVEFGTEAGTRVYGSGPPKVAARVKRKGVVFDHPGVRPRSFLWAAWWQISPKFEPRVKALVEKLIAEGFRPGQRR